MGVIKLFSSASTSNCARDHAVVAPPPNPNPFRFKVEACVKYGAYLVAQVRYPDCTTYEGIKILVFKDRDEAWISSRSKIDPHFTSADTSLLARFSPSQEGLDAAVAFAKGMSGL